MINIKTQEQFEEKIISKDPTLVFFSGGEGCQKCVVSKRNLPLVEEKLAGVLVVYLDINDVPELFEKYQITHYPILAIFIEGKLIASRGGVGIPEGIKDWFKSTTKELINE